MNLPALIFLVISVLAVLFLPRKWAPIPLLATCCYMNLGQGVELGPISLPILRLVLAAGLVRIFLRHERITGRSNAIDKLMVAWGAWMVFASFFHEPVPGAGPVYASGLVYNVALVYLLIRIWCCDLSELMAVVRMLAWLLVPVAASMILEHVLQRNLFGLLGGASEEVFVRDGSIRAQGPFAHPILAGTVGAVCFPLMIGIWRNSRFSAAVGCAACVAIVFASTSSSPLMSLFIALGGLLMWFYQSWVRVARWGLVVMYLLLSMLMTRPVYYLIQDIDLTGSSTGWHRARVIEMAIEHLPEWWLFGTDYTFHWMGIAVDAAGRHSDITNYYIWIGVIGGLPAMLLVIAMIWRAFVWVGKCLPAFSSKRDHQVMIWCVGSSLLAQVCTGVSVSFTDQSMTFLWMNIAAVSSMYSSAILANKAVRPRIVRVGSPASKPRDIQMRSHPNRRQGSRS